MKITAREKRFVTIGGSVCAAVLGWYLVTTLIPSQADLSSALELRKRRLLQQKEIIREEETYKARVVQYQERLNLDYQRCLPGTNPSVASAELQKLLSDLAAQAGVEIQQKNIQKEQKLQDDLIKISVRIETSCNPQQLVQFLTAIENYEKYLTLDDLMISGLRLQRRIETRPAMTVSGLITVPEGKTEQKPAPGK